MITKSAKNILWGICTLGYNCGSNGFIPFKTTSGETKYATPNTGSYYPYSNRNVQFCTSYGTSVGVRVGTGTTMPTEDDYKLESLITSGLSASYTDNIEYDDDGYPKRVVTYTFKNTSSSAITISEIGLFSVAHASKSKTTSATTSECFMIDRCLVSPAVTLEADGGIAVLEYKMACEHIEE